MLHGAWGLEYSVVLRAVLSESITFSSIFLFLYSSSSELNIEHAPGIETETKQPANKVNL